MRKISARYFLREGSKSAHGELGLSSVSVNQRKGKWGCVVNLRNRNSKICARDFVYW
jgi:hypothetical protein